MAVTRISQSSLKQGLKKNRNFVAGLTPGVEKFDSIQTISVGVGGQANIEFTNIPQNYQNLQIRLVARTGMAAVDDALNIIFNSDTSSSYASHYFYGNRSTLPSGANINSNRIFAYRLSGNNAAANIFGSIIIEILDYASSSKTKTIRYFGGTDFASSGEVFIGTGLWYSTNAITSIRLSPNSATNFSQRSTAALYGTRI